jgi:hypothetical protein
VVVVVGLAEVVVVLAEVVVGVTVGLTEVVDDGVVAEDEQDAISKPTTTITPARKQAHLFVFTYFSFFKISTDAFSLDTVRSIFIQGNKLLFCFHSAFSPFLFFLPTFPFQSKFSMVKVHNLGSTMSLIFFKMVSFVRYTAILCF